MAEVLSWVKGKDKERRNNEGRVGTGSFIAAYDQGLICSPHVHTPRFRASVASESRV
jgi:hypothetical protein